MERTHYQILELEPTASTEAIVTALHRLSDQAALLVYTSPQRSHDLWERIRQIREDLLLDPERRAAYDRSLLVAREAVSAPAQTFTVPTPSRMVQRQPAPRRKTFLWQSFGGVAVLALAVALFVVFAHRARTTRTPSPLALSLSSTGLQHRSHYVSGQLVHLRWSRVPHALVYRVQVAAGRGVAKDLAIFRHPMLTHLTLGTTYTFKVVGPQIYYWRVQAYIRDAWSPYTRAQHFVVARPIVAPSVPRTPPVRIARGPTRKTSHPVVAAVVRGSRGRVASRSRGQNLLTPGSYQAAQTVRQVAALVSAPSQNVRRPASPTAPRVSPRPPASTLPTGPAPRPPALGSLPAPRPPRSTPVPAPAPKPPPVNTPVPTAGPRPPVSPPAGTPAPKPPPVNTPVPTAGPRPPVSPPAGTPAPRPPASPSPASSPPVGTVTYPVGNAPIAPPAPPRSPVSPAVPVGALVGTPAQGTVSSAPQRPPSAPVPAPTAPSAPPWPPPHKHH